MRLAAAPLARACRGARLRARGRAPAFATAAAAAEPAPAAEVPAPAAREARLAYNQLRTAGALLAQLAPHVRSDASLPLRLRDLAGQRLFNSSSRRLYRELLWTAVRHWHARARARAAGGCASRAWPGPRRLPLR